MQGDRENACHHNHGVDEDPPQGLPVHEETEQQRKNAAEQGSESRRRIGQSVAWKLVHTKTPMGSFPVRTKGTSERQPMGAAGCSPLEDRTLLQGGRNGVGQVRVCGLPGRGFKNGQMAPRLCRDFRIEASQWRGCDTLPERYLFVSRSRT